MANFNAVAIFRGLITLFMYNNLIIKDFRNQLLLNTFQMNDSHLEHQSNFSSKIDHQNLSRNLKFSKSGVIEEFEEKLGICCKKLILKLEENEYHQKIILLHRYSNIPYQDGTQV